jgi:hypothetical protein
VPKYLQRGWFAFLDILVGLLIAAAIVWHALRYFLH